MKKVLTVAWMRIPRGQITIAVQVADDADCALVESLLRHEEWS